MVNWVIVHTRNLVRRLLRGESGAQTIEWIALSLLVLVLLMGVVAVAQDDKTFAQAVLDKIKGLINKAGGES